MILLEKKSLTIQKAAEKLIHYLNICHTLENIVLNFKNYPFN